MPRSLRAHPHLRRLGLVSAATVLAATSAALGLTARPGEAAANTSTPSRTTTRSCVDGGGVTWHTKVVWGGTYVASNGVRKISVSYAGWTSTLGSIATDSSVQTYSGKGKLLSTLKRTATVNYQQGTVYKFRNPLNPPVGGKIVIRMSQDDDGFPSCKVTHAQPTTADPVIAAVGDMVCPLTYSVTSTRCQQMAISDSISAAKPAALFTLGDNQYYEGTLAQFQGAYAPSYGRMKAITNPALGNHEYRTPGAAGYFDYFGTAGGDRMKGYYSQDVGSWHVVTLNSEQDTGAAGGQMAWLKNDLATHTDKCTLAITHRPLFSAGREGSYPSMKPFYDALVAAHAELLLSGHDHDYERFKPQTGNGTASSTGLIQIVTGTGGKNVTGWDTVVANTAVRSHAGFGWTKVTLHPTSADLSYVPVGANTFTDHTTIKCH